METVNFSNFRSNLKNWFDKVVNDVSGVIIKRKGGKDLVLISLDDYNSLKETILVLSGKNRVYKFEEDSLLIAACRYHYAK